MPDVTIVAECFEITTEDEISTYWYSVTNNEEVAVTVKVNGIDVPLAAGETKLVPADANGVTVTWNAKTVTAAAELDDSSTDITTNEDVCQIKVDFVKDVNGPAPGADTLYTIRVSYILVDGENVEYVEQVTFDLAAGDDVEPTVVPLPSTFNPEGIDYIIEEIDAQGAANSSVTPGTFTTNGHLGETISVVIVNDFASVEILKEASATQVAINQPISYELTVNNTGAIDLSPVVIDDLFPVGVSFTGYTIEGGAPIVCEDLADGPDYIVCTFEGVLAAGATLPVITLNAVVNGEAAGSDLVNESRVVGIYAGDEEASVGSDDLLSTTAIDVPTVLSCEPTEGQVCDLSPKAATTVDTTTTTVDATTTTTQLPATTTTIIVTTTSVASEGPTTTVDPGPSTTQDLLSEGPIGTPAPEVELPGTGGNSTNLVLIAFLLFGSGLAITATARRRSAFGSR